MITLNLTEDEIMTALRGFIVSILPAAVEVVRGQDNNVPMPSVPDFVLMTPAARTQLATTTHDYRDDDGEKDVGRATSFGFQLDFFGPASADNAQIFSNLFRDDHGCAFLAPRGVVPLYCDDGRQMPLVTGEKQYVARWMLNGVLQANLVVTAPQQFADSLVTTLIQADGL